MSQSVPKVTYCSHTLKIMYTPGKTASYIILLGSLVDGYRGQQRTEWRKDLCKRSSPVSSTSLPTFRSGGSGSYVLVLINDRGRSDSLLWCPSYFVDGANFWTRELLSVRWRHGVLLGKFSPRLDLVVERTLKKLPSHIWHATRSLRFVSRSSLEDLVFRVLFYSSCRRIKDGVGAG